MSETVFILGAGASKEAGAPVMANFLDRARDVAKQPLDNHARERMDLVFRARDELQRVHSKARLDLDNIESLFAAFEMAKVMGLLGSLSEGEIIRLPEAMRATIILTLERSISLPLKNGRVRPPAAYESFARLLRQLVDRKRSASVITLNYDLCLDFALTLQGLPPDYCLGPAPRPGSLKVVKLHGSMNWTKCPSCQRTVAWEMEQYIQRHTWLPTPGATSGRLEVASKIGEFCHCGSVPACHVLIVPPTWDKVQYHGDLQSVWRAGAKELSDAEYIFVIGYSLPATDQFFRYFYALSSVGPARLRHFHVLNPDASLEARYQEVLGPQAKNRYVFSPFIFSGTFAAIGERLGVDWAALA